MRPRFAQRAQPSAAPPGWQRSKPPKKFCPIAQRSQSFLVRKDFTSLLCKLRCISRHILILFLYLCRFVTEFLSRFSARILAASSEHFLKKSVAFFLFSWVIFFASASRAVIFSRKSFLSDFWPVSLFFIFFVSSGAFWPFWVIFDCILGLDFGGKGFSKMRSHPPRVEPLAEGAGSSAAPNRPLMTQPASTEPAAISRLSLCTAQNFAGVLVRRNVADSGFSEDERTMIHQWGLTNKQKTPPQDVTAQYLSREHRNHFYTLLGYARYGEELKKVWDNWWKANKHKRKQW